MASVHLLITIDSFAVPENVATTNDGVRIAPFT